MSIFQNIRIDIPTLDTTNKSRILLLFWCSVRQRLYRFAIQIVQQQRIKNLMILMANRNLPCSNIKTYFLFLIFSNCYYYSWNSTYTNHVINCTFFSGSVSDAPHNKCANIPLLLNLIHVISESMLNCRFIICGFSG